MIFGQCDPGKTPTTLGENQFESSSLFLKIFYREIEIHIKIPTFTKYNLSRFLCINPASKIVPTAKQKTTENLQH